MKRKITKLNQIASLKDSLEKGKKEKNLNEQIEDSKRTLCTLN